MNKNKYLLMGIIILLGIIGVNVASAVCYNYSNGRYPVVTNDMVLYYHFNNDSCYGENSTLVYDFSGKGNNGTAVNVTFQNGTGILNDGSLIFNGVNSNINSGNASSIDIRNNISIAFWIKTNTSAPTEENIISKNSQYRIILPAGASRLDMILTGLSDSTMTGGGTYVSDNIWHFIVFTYDGQNMKSYKDGLLTDTEASTGSINSSSEKLMIGSQNGLVKFFNGSLDEVMIFNYSLSAQQIWNYYFTYYPIIYDGIRIPFNTTLDGGTYYLNGSGSTGIIRLDINSNVNLNCNGTTIIGNSNRSDVNNTGIFVSNNIYNSTIRNCNLIGFRNCISSYGAYTSIHNNNVSDCLQGIAFSDGSALNSYNSIFNNFISNSYMGIKVESGSNYNLIDSNTIINSSHNGIECVGAYNNITNNIINDTEHSAIDFLAIINGTIHDNFIKGNRINKELGLDSLYNKSGVFYLYMAYNNIFRDNIFTGGQRLGSGLGSQAIILQGNTSLYNGMSSNNQFINNSFDEISSELIVLREANNNTFTDNIFTNSYMWNTRGYQYYSETDVYNTTWNFENIRLKFIGEFHGGFNYSDNLIIIKNTDSSIISIVNLYNLSYPYNDIRNVSNNVILYSNVNEVNLTLAPGQAIEVGDFKYYDILGNVDPICHEATTNTIEALSEFDDWLSIFIVIIVLGVIVGIVLSSNYIDGMPLVGVNFSNSLSSLPAVAITLLIFIIIVITAIIVLSAMC